jgi:hypothetical protein
MTDNSQTSPSASNFPKVKFKDLFPGERFSYDRTNESQEMPRFMKTDESFACVLGMDVNLTFSTTDSVVEVYAIDRPLPENVTTDPLTDPLKEFEKLLRANIAAQDVNDNEKDNQTMDQLDALWERFSETERKAANELTLSIAQELNLSERWKPSVWRGLISYNNF